ncbi:hypothetical protein PsorP6_011528 [Peronosclerospora sorghi]|uniref:Uncharacterized protein n=1 Tax=Peronosclerospora sorghi TaxID=230839 RepID=A0ACC0WJM5_9STRA|nr:hypothetical protein PsorP6_011528 [Peronosclerospora sorghi]
MSTISSSRLKRLERRINVMDFHHFLYIYATVVVVDAFPPVRNYSTTNATKMTGKLRESTKNSHYESVCCEKRASDTLLCSGHTRRNTNSPKRVTLHCKPRQELNAVEPTYHTFEWHDLCRSKCSEWLCGSMKFRQTRKCPRYGGLRSINRLRA